MTCLDTYTAPVLTEMAETWLRKEFPDSLIMREFNAAKWGGALIDVAAITDTKIIGVEIKGDGDSPTRLKLQGPAYSAVASHMFLLCTPQLYERVEKGAHKPLGWYHLKVSGGEVKPVYDWMMPRIKKSLKPDLPNSPAALLDILWKPELVRVARALGCTATTRHNVDQLVEMVGEYFSLSKIRPLVIHELRHRNWHFKKKSIAAKPGKEARP